jgi:hypothetical protein
MLQGSIMSMALPATPASLKLKGVRKRIEARKELPVLRTERKVIHGQEVDVRILPTKYAEGAVPGRVFVPFAARRYAIIDSIFLETGGSLTSQAVVPSAGCARPTPALAETQDLADSHAQGLTEATKRNGGSRASWPRDPSRAGKRLDRTDCGGALEDTVQRAAGASQGRRIGVDSPAT